ncbi:HD domain-containing protein [Nocardia sp. 2]|uniref:HD domain-containing protein n=1 Tax=Nocardia acididurans TaxID=2802282 RepID=A0ABS1M6X9_9NOCA|nr:HD domain-containing protein [Nocardia acididurans]
MNDLAIPDSAVARAALDVATAYSSPALLNHSVRSYVWAATLAQQEQIDFDAELLYVAAALHDLGLVAVFDSHTVPFEEAGGHVAAVFAAGAGWSRDRRNRLIEIIVRHMWDEVDVAMDAEGHLLARATTIDISGRGTDLVPPGLRTEVLRAWPRLDLAEDFARCFAEQARRKPDSAAAGAVRAGIAERLRNNPLEGV